jgi:hypothetical protein
MYAIPQAKAADANGSAPRLQCDQALHMPRTRPTASVLNNTDGTDMLRPDPAVVSGGDRTYGKTGSSGEQQIHRLQRERDRLHRPFRSGSLANPGGRSFFHHL